MGAIHATIAETTGSMLGQHKGACSAIVSAATASSAPLDAADAAIAVGDGDALQKALDQVRAQMQRVGEQVAAALAQVRAGLDKISSTSHELTAGGNDLAADITRAQTRADEAAQAAEALDKQKWYYLALGPLGLVGLAACIALIVEADAKVNRIRQDVSTLRGQAAQQKKVQADLDLLRQEVPTVSTTLLSLKNGLNFIASDTSGIVGDARRAPGSAIAKAFLLTARYQVQTLLQDAS